MKTIGLKIKRVRWEAAVHLCTRLAAGFLAAGCALEGRAPLASGLTAACTSRRDGLAVCLGASAGCFLLQPFGAALRCCGVMVIELAVLSAFRETKWGSFPAFRPLTAAGATLAVEMAYALQMGLQLRVVIGLLSSTVLAGVLCHYFGLLAGARPRHRKSSGETLKQRLKLGADALRSLGESLGTPICRREENPAVIFDRAAEVVCRGCALRDVCWSREYVSTFNAFNDATPALLERGEARPEDFAPYFASRCIHFPQLLAAINTETRALLLRRQYRRELERERQRTRGQYAQLTEFVAQAMSVQEPQSSGKAMPFRVFQDFVPKAGQRLCGDSLTHFQVGDRLYLVLSDGMGSGREAQRESQLTLRLLEQFLRAGIQAEPALRTMNAALNLRSDDQGSFTTIDLLALDLTDGRGELYKYGAAPSYIKRQGAVRRLTGSSLPAGLQDAGILPEPARFPLESGSFFVMISDGVADEGDDEWLQNLLAGWQGENPEELGRLIFHECGERRKGEDDASVLCLYLEEERGKRQV